VEFNGRYDGSSKFPSGNRFGFFPSVSVGYNIAREEFWPIKDIMSSFKIRGSWGTLGNQDVQSDLYLSTINIGTKYSYIINGELPNTLGAPGLISSDLTWEKSSTLDFGFDAALFSNRLNVTFDWYNRKTLDMFGPANPVPAVLGASIPQQNNADLSTKGFEISIGWRDQIRKNINYNVGLVLSDNKSKITRYNNPNNLIDEYYVGRDLHEIWGYKTAGIIQTDEQLANMPDQSIFYGKWGKGDIMYEDLDGDNEITYGKRVLGNTGDYRIIGNSNPRFAFGITAGASWENFDLSLFLQGVGKRDYAPPGGNNAGVLFWGFVGGWGTNLYKETMDFWTEENTSAYYPKPYNSGEVAKNQQVQTHYLQNAAYMRLKNIQLGYTLPASVVNLIKLHKIRFYITGENLLTFTRLHKNFDPETLGGWAGHMGKTYPITKSIALGVNIDF
jgi:TonB-linked SusC/RagA family outer membrane protein